ncbi:MAG: hypothetical protein ACK5O7_02240 [Holosporales bacterium]
MMRIFLLSLFVPVSLALLGTEADASSNQSSGEEEMSIRARHVQFALPVSAEEDSRTTRDTNGRFLRDLGYTPPHRPGYRVIRSEGQYYYVPHHHTAEEAARVAGAQAERLHDEVELENLRWCAAHPVPRQENFSVSIFKTCGAILSYLSETFWHWFTPAAPIENHENTQYEK